MSSPSPTPDESGVGVSSQPSRRSLSIALGVEHDISALARAAYPEECCGILGGSIDPAGRPIVSAAIGARNIAPARDRHFSINPAEIRAAEEELYRAGLDLIGYFHSHPDGPGAPSRSDIESAGPWPGFVQCILAVTSSGGTQPSWFVTGNGEWLPMIAQGVPA